MAVVLRRTGRRGLERLLMTGQNGAPLQLLSAAVADGVVLRHTRRTARLPRLHPIGLRFGAIRCHAVDAVTSR